MTRDQVISRIATKAGCPALVDFMNGENVQLPTECLPWGGAIRRKPRRLKKTRSSDFRPYAHPVAAEVTPIIRWNKKERSVSRLIYLFRMPDTIFTLRRRCNTPECVNPTHFEVILRMEEISQEDLHAGWTIEEAITALERALSFEEVTTWEQLLTMPTLVDVPVNLLEKAVNEIGKGHLLSGRG